MRSERFISLAAVIVLLATVQAANDASLSLSTLTLTRTVYNKPTAVPVVTGKAPASDFPKSRDQNSHEQHTTVNHPHEAPQPITYHITEIHHATQAPSNVVVPSAQPIPVSSASPPVVIVSASPAVVNPAKPTQVNNGEEVIIKTITKKNKTKLKTKTNKINTTAMHPVTQSAPMPVNPVHTSSASVAPISQQPVSASMISGSSVAPPQISKSVMSGPSSVMMPSASGSASQPMGTSLLLSGSIPPAAATSSADSASAMVSMSVSQSASAMPTPVIIVAQPAPSAPSAAPVAKQSPSIDSVNNANKKINPPTASTNPANGASSDRSVGPALFLAWIMAAVAAF